MMKLLAIGEVMAELRQAEQGFSVSFAGDSFNTAIYAARTLNRAGAVGYYTRIGTEPLSHGLRKMAESESLDCRYIIGDEEKNIGIYAVSTDVAGERSFHYWRHDSAARRLFGEQTKSLALPEAEIIYLSGITLAIMAPQARERLFDLLEQRKGQSLIAFDSNYRPSLWESRSIARQVMARMWMLSDIALPSIDDEMALFGEESEADVCERFMQKQWHRLVLKRAERGPLAPLCAGADGTVFDTADSVIDTTAAGDSFNGGYLGALLSGATELDCLKAGHRLASIVVGHRGAIIPSEACQKS